MERKDSIESSVFIAEGARVIGDVKIGRYSSIWYNAVVRADSTCIRIGESTNIQDLSCLHVDLQDVLDIGDNVTVGHGAIVHSCTVGNNVIIGMGAIILNGAKVGNNCIIGAGALVTENAVIPDGTLAFGSPARVIRQLTEEEKTQILENARLYVEHAEAAKIISHGKN